MSPKSFGLVLLALIVIGIGPNAQPAIGQSTPESVASANQRDKNDETNLDTQLYILVATNQEIDDPRLPAALDSVVKQLRASFPFKNYRLAATLINRVKNEGRLNLKWVGGPLGTAATTTLTPSFNEFRVNAVKLTTDSKGQPFVRMEGFGYGSRIPIQTGAMAAAGVPSAPVINYESTGLNTDISMREGEPVIVGTLNVGTSGEAIILVISARRTSR